MTAIGGRVVDEALKHADDTIERAGDAPYVAIETRVLALLVRWIDQVRPMRQAPADPKRWQDAVDAVVTAEDEK